MQTGNSNRSKSNLIIIYNRFFKFKGFFIFANVNIF